MTKGELEEIKDNMRIVLYNNHTYKAVPYEDWNKIISALERVSDFKEQLTSLICAVYEHANEGTELMEIAEKIDEME